MMKEEKRKERKREREKEIKKSVIVIKPKAEDYLLRQTNHQPTNHQPGSLIPLGRQTLPR
jgi:hypothetical protein